MMTQIVKVFAVAVVAVCAFAAGATAQNQSKAAKTNRGPQPRTTYYRASSGTGIPPVLLSQAEVPLCKVKVGDTMPAIKLPNADIGEATELAKLYGPKATVVAFWKADRRMSHQMLADLGPDVIEPLGKNGVSVVGVAVNDSANSAKAAMAKNGAKFPNLIDADGAAFAQIGTERLPRVYLLDPQGKILYFDIEYSNATRRELQQALRTLAGAAGQSGK